VRVGFDRVGFGIVGTGLIAGMHARALAGVASARLVSCLSRDAARAGKFAEEHGCAAFSDIDAFLAHADLDAVSICTPSGAHLQPALAAASAGKHLFVEKPLEVTLERCQRIIDAAEAAGVICSGVFQSRSLPDVLLIRRALEQGRFGHIVVGDAIVKWVRPASYYQDNWHGTRALDGGGALMNQSIHTIDLLQWLLGPIDSLQAFTTRRAHAGLEVEDTAVAAVRFASGALGTIQGSTAIHPGFERRIEIGGTAGSAVLVGDSVGEWQFADETDEDEALRARRADSDPDRGGASDPAGVGIAGHRRQYEEVTAAILQGNRPDIDGHDAMAAVAIVLAIYESARSGQPITPAVPTPSS
jgi:predicted dehydrogenase